MSRVEGELERAVIEAVDLLLALEREQVPPIEAEARLRRMAPLPGGARRLLWEVQPIDGSHHYDVLLELGAGTLTVGLSPAHALPWPLRGTHRWSDGELLRVNGLVMKVDQALSLIDGAWNVAPVRAELVDAALILEELSRRPVELEPSDLQVALDLMRRAHGLHTAEATRRWMMARGIDHEELERLATNLARVERLKARIASGRVEAHFEAHRADFESIQIAAIAYPDRAAAERAQAELAAGVSFYELAERLFLDGRPGVVHRTITGSQEERDLLAAAPGEVVRVEREGEWVLARVLRRCSARLDEGTRRRITERLFAEWLTERRQGAQIEWNWGRR